jgi:hypothetical protein
MPADEKEYNGFLLDQLHALQRIEKIAKKIGNEELLEALEEEKMTILVNPEIVLQISGFYSSIIRTHLADGVACHLMTPVRLHSRP